MAAVLKASHSATRVTTDGHERARGGLRKVQIQILETFGYTKQKWSRLCVFEIMVSKIAVIPRCKTGVGFSLENVILWTVIC